MSGESNEPDGIATSRAPQSAEPETAAPLDRVPLPHAGESGSRPVVRVRPSTVGLVALATGLLVTAALALGVRALYNHNEQRLLSLRGRELGLVLSATAPSIQTPLAGAAALASATNGSPSRFRAFLAPYVGPKGQFQSVSLWRLGSPHPAPLAVVGAAPMLASEPQRAEHVLAPGAKPRVLSVTGMIDEAHPKVSFEFASGTKAGAYAVYTENLLPPDRRSRIESNSAFSDLNYALYLGRAQRTPDLLVTSEKTLPMRGRTASDTVPFGASTFTLVVSPKGPLGGDFFHDLPWIIVILGVLVSSAAAVLVDRLARRRARAEQLAGSLDRMAAENRELYIEQRGISETLQHALLPETLPTVEGMRVSARYVPAGRREEVGGDWYDVLALEDGRMLLIIGDVSGHGLEAATTMALLRHASLAYAVQDPSPGSVLTRLSAFVNANPHSYFATVLCALVDVEQHRVTLASAGHLPPLAIEDGHARFLDVTTSPPIGFPGSLSRYAGGSETVAQVSPKTTLVAFTDGLVERRGEVLDVGMDRLRDVAASERLPVADLLAKLAGTLTSANNRDDTALVGIEWQI